MFEWDSRYSTGITSIDTQHQNLFAIGRELRDAMAAGNGKAAVRHVLDRLASYTRMHFAHEERLMRNHHYPGLVEHKAEHDEIRRQVEQFRLDFRRSQVPVNVQLLLFLKGWLETHIGGSDQQFAPYLQIKPE